jgi:shikimate dehydrogenase
MINGKTKVCAIIGDPIEHSLSPTIHNAAFQACGFDYVFVAFRVKREELKEAVQGMRALNIAGCCVTIPHKVAVISYLDNVDPLAAAIGSVNTIVNNNGLLTGYNTDAPGFLEPIANKGIALEGKNVVMLGAGGAARAVSFMLVNAGVKLTILNRTVEKAADLADRLKKSLNKDVVPCEMSPENLERTVTSADILVNTTSIGMTPDVTKTPVPAGLLRKGLVVYDIIYNPGETRLLREAKGKGAVVLNGEEMLAWQGALAFEKWMGQKPPIDIMIKELRKALGTHED